MLGFSLMQRVILNMQECGFLRFEWEEEIDLQILNGIEALDQE